MNQEQDSIKHTTKKKCWKLRYGIKNEEKRRQR